ncbi:MAG: ATP-binding protein, partial [Thermoplasmata archaeon]
MAPHAPRPFLGRPEIREVFRERRQLFLRGEGALSVLEGDAGVGKSTFLSELLAECRLGGSRVLFARAHRTADPAPFQWVREALRSAAPAGSAEAPPDPDVSSADRIAELLRSLGAPSEPLRTQGLAPLAESFFELARRQPTVVALEDLGYADGASLELLGHLASQVGPHPLWIVVTSPPVRELGPTARRFLDSLPRTPSIDRWSLRPLAPAEIAEFARWVDPKRVPGLPELSQWYSQTGGNPLFLEQILRAPRRSVSSFWEAARASALPWAEFVLGRFVDLPAEERSVLAAASVLGGEFPFGLLTAVTGEEEERLSELVEHLVERGFLIEAGLDRIEFARDDLREPVYAALPEGERTALHGRVARALEGSGSEDTDTLFACAHHAFAGRLDHLAAESNRAAARIAIQTGSFEIARLHLEQALESHRREEPEGRAVELELTLELALVLDRLGSPDRAETLLREAMRSAPGAARPGGIAAELLPIYLARILTDQGRWEEAALLTAELLAGVDRRTAPAARLALYRLRGEIEYFRGDYPEAIRNQDRALELARTLADSREVALITVRRASALAMMPDCLEEAIPAYREATEVLLLHGDRAEAAYALLYLGATLAQNGRDEEGRRELERAVTLAEEASDLRQLGWALFTLAEIHRARGQFPEARRRNERARAILLRIGDQFGEAQTHLIGGRIALGEDRPAEAEGELLEAFRLVRRLRSAPDEIEVLLRLAEAALGRGDRDLAEERLRELAGREVERLRPDLAGEIARFVRRTV